jgi:tetraacyldisaccharide 4'-kinase
MQPPAFWRRERSTVAALLAPVSIVWRIAAARRARRVGWRAPVPVLCCGNASVGGAGKTTLALDLGARLKRRGLEVAFLTRGYGGKVQKPLRVDVTQHEAALVGDEALLLAAIGTTWVSADRAAGARAAVAAGAQVLVMDDGLQNPSLAKDVSLLVVDGAVGFGNGRVMPAGPLREPVAAAARRCRAAVVIGEDATDVARLLPRGLPVLPARLRPGNEVAHLRGWPVVAFAGIGRPEKFFTMLEDAGLSVVSRRPFADHHPFSPAELRALRNEAERLCAIRVTTMKDAVRLFPAQRVGVRVVGVRLVWDDPAAVERLLDDLMQARG